MSRRSLGRALLGLAVLVAMPTAVTVGSSTPAAAAEPVGAIDARAWRWETLPGTDGLSVFSTVAVRVTWTVDGVVSAGGLTVTTMPPYGGRTDTMNWPDTGLGEGLSVRRKAR